MNKKPYILMISLLTLLAATSAKGQSCDQTPTAIDDAVEFRGEVTLWVDVLANDRELDGEEVSVVLGSNNCSGGQVSVDFGTLRLELPLNSTESCSIDYRLRDTSGELSSTATVAVTDLLIFGDRFNSTALNQWSVCVGC